jgi:hypothetical protein
MAHGPPHVVCDACKPGRLESWPDVIEQQSGEAVLGQGCHQHSNKTAARCADQRHAIHLQVVEYPQHILQLNGGHITPDIGAARPAATSQIHRNDPPFCVQQAEDRLKVP